MKNINYILGCTLFSAAILTTSCVDESLLDYQVDKPAVLEELEYLNDYDVLKSYVNRTTDPNFKLGAALAASDYNAKGLVYRLANANFDEVTAGNEMKYSSIVRDDGSMNFGTVSAFVSAAKEAGTTIYGHTLAWHSQQNNKYLNSLLADREVQGSGDGDNALLISNITKGANPWDQEIYYDLATPLVEGQEYTINISAQGEVAGSMNFWPGVNGGATQYLASLPIGEGKYADGSITFVANIPINRLRFCFGPYEGKKMYFDNVSLKATGSDEELVANGSFDDDSPNGWTKPSWHGFSFAVEPLVSSGNVYLPVYVFQEDYSGGTPMRGWGGNSTRTVVDGVLEMNNPDEKQFWEVQAAQDFAEPFEVGTVYYLKMRVKGSVDGSISAGFQNPDGYKGCGDFPSISITKDWKEIVVQTTISGEGATRFLFSYGAYKGTLYIDDIALYWEKSASAIPLTPEEKREVLTEAMNNWIKGMMEACDGYVTTWDVVNEAISGVDKDNDGVYELQSVNNVSADDAKNNFYWQDHMGDVEYVRTAVAAARKYFAEFNGDPSKLKLFINDYNLESDWDDNKKLKSLIAWIKTWEEDNVTKIDGIGTQMHVSFHANKATQASKEKHVENMFKLMAETGKLVKVSELDMGYVDESGKSVRTVDLTNEQHKEMAEYYKFIVKKYFEIVPASQRYGITQWCVTDSPENSGWRKGEPTGLWDANYYRKHTYAGFADGLAGK